MVFLQGTALSARERALLQRPAVGGVIFFSRNYIEKKQLSDLISEITEVSPGLILAADHEGGRVQRFKEGFTRLPPMRSFGRLYEREPERSLDLLYSAGRLTASELRETGLHTAFSPVLDLFSENNGIGDRALHGDPDVVVRLARSFIKGLTAGGLLPVGKHFPGHGTVAGDTHCDVVEDDRSYEQIAASDLKAFRDLIEESSLQAVMAAHVIYPKVDAAPAGLSRRWLKEILRDEIGFDGVVFSDDLAMRGIHADGDAAAGALLEAGCDMVLICRDSQLLRRAVDGLSDEELERRGRALDERWRRVQRRLAEAAAEDDWDADDAREELATFRANVESRLEFF